VTVEPILRVRNLQTQFVTKEGTFDAVRGVSFEV
jgi:ABC-type dipeptide/oligopeptide/nickel transport system ATPase component